MLSNATDYSVIRRESREDEGSSYIYELMMRRSESVASFRIPLYSIRINMTDPYGNEGSADVKDAFSDVERALEFFDKIVRNLATPIDLAYILEDEMT